jgi:hypothetical protein
MRTLVCLVSVAAACLSCVKAPEDEKGTADRQAVELLDSVAVATNFDVLGCAFVTSATTSAWNVDSISLSRATNALWLEMATLRAHDSVPPTPGNYAWQAMGIVHDGHRLVAFVGLHKDFLDDRGPYASMVPQLAKLWGTRPVVLCDVREGHIFALVDPIVPRPLELLTFGGR